MTLTTVIAAMFGSRKTVEAIDVSIAGIDLIDHSLRDCNVDMPTRINGLSLFSGIGGIDIALSEWVKTTAYCEIDPYCQAVLLSRMATDDLETAPIWTDIKTLRAPTTEILWGHVDIIFGGFPCQDISVAGLGKGLGGERSGLFFEIMRLAKEIKPLFLFLENVPAITTRGGLQVVRTLTEMGYDCRWCTISAASVGALHRRERWFLLANAQYNGESSCKEWCSIKARVDPRWAGIYTQMFGKTERTSGLPFDVADSDSQHCDKKQGREASRAQKGHPESSYSCSDESINTMCESGEQADQGAQSLQKGGESRGGSSRQCWPFESREHWQETVSSMGKCTDGIPNLVDRLRSLGNAVVPEQTKEAFKILMGLK